MFRRTLFRSFFMRVYLGLMAISLLFTLIAAIGWDYAPHQQRDRFQHMSTIAGEIAAGLLPAQDADIAKIVQVLEHWHARASIDLAVFDTNGVLLAKAGRTPPEFADLQTRTSFGSGAGRGFLATLPDGRSLFVRPNMRGARTGFSRGWLGFLWTLSIATLLLGLVSYPVARRLSARIERLEKGVQALGAGDLKARVKVEGNDEVASLAASFNQSAQRVEQLLDAQRDLLANASHEFRSPLARIRMALELLPKGGESTELRHELTRDVVELDQLVDEILLASRLQADSDIAQSVFEELDLAALCAEECARVNAAFVYSGLAPADSPPGVSSSIASPIASPIVSSPASLPSIVAPAGFAAGRQGSEKTPAVFRGDARLLRRLIRNLLENALRYGDGLPVELRLDANTMIVADRGRGVPEEDRLRIFEPFYRSRNASEKSGGVGLGLSLARQIAARHGASIVCQPRVGGGSEFVVNFP